MHNGVVRGGLIAAAVLMLIGAVTAVSAAERWAAVAPNSENASRVFWGDSRDEAIGRAAVGCQRISKTCADKPASTNDMDDIFVTVCCNKPRYGCATSPDHSVKDGRAGAMKVFDDAGFSQCSLTGALRARDGSSAR